jgi:D-alanyl-D-alanine carboxypeptidase
VGSGRSKVLAVAVGCVTLSAALPVVVGMAATGAPSGPVAAEVELVEVEGIGLTSATWAPEVRALLAAAAADGVTLTGSSYRDRSSQVLLRRAHCGSSHYAIYEMPASQCSPPTARPGTSLHERGLAIDFDDCATRATVYFRWLVDNAKRFGLRNLPSEAWHWSSTGG